MRIDLFKCTLRDCRWYLSGKCCHKPAFEQCEYARLKDRLEIGPDGSDKIDELEDAMEYVRDERDRLKKEVQVLRKQLVDIEKEKQVDKCP